MQAGQQLLSGIKHLSQKLIQDKYQQQLIKLLSQNQSLQSLLSYCQSVYNSLQQSQPIIQQLQQYSPRQISKILLQPQLNKLQSYFNIFPQQKCKLSHFIIILIQVINVSFQQTPKYLIGLLQIFKQLNINNTISYNHLFTYIIGQITTLHQQQQNTTEFQVHYQEKKKQDYLLHGNGIKRIYHASDMGVYIVLDYDSDLIKIYNQQMRIITRYQPNKQKHYNKTVKITHFDFNQFNNKLAITCNDKSIELVNLYNYLNKSREQFQKMYLSYEVFYLQQVIIHIEFIQMTNKWLTITQTNLLVLYNLQKTKQSPQQQKQQQFSTLITLWQDPKQQLKITNILQIVPLSTICIVAGNQVFFFNQKLNNNKKYNKYNHGSNIKLIKYSEDKNSFFILGQQKVLTILIVQRSSVNFKLSSYPINHIVRDFQVFPHFQTILLTDNQHNLYLYDLKTLICYQTSSYSHIANKKKSTKHIRILRTSKDQFIIYQSYMLSMIQQKVALQKQIQYNIDKQAYYDQQRQQVLISVNNQIIKFNILRREIVEIYNNENSTIDRGYLRYFVCGQNNNKQIMTIDKEMRLGFVESVVGKKNSDQMRNSRRQCVGKRLEMEEVKMASYCYNKKNDNNDKNDKGLIYVLGRGELYQIEKYQDNKQLTILRQLILHNFSQIITYSIIQQTHQLLITTDQNILYLIQLQHNFTIKYSIKLIFDKDNLMLEEIHCIQSQYLAEYGIIVVLANNNILYLVNIKQLANNNMLYLVNIKQKGDNYLSVKLLEAVNYAQVDIDFKFKKMVVEKVIEHKDNKGISKVNNKDKEYKQDKVIIAMFSTQNGHFLQINLTPYIKLLLDHHQTSNQTSNQTNINNNNNNNNYYYYQAIQTNKNKYLLNSHQIKPKPIHLSQQSNSTHLLKNTYIFDKRHEKQIIIMKSIYLQKHLILTISKDGQIKLYHHNQPVSIIRLPNLTNKYSNIKDIQTIKINKSSIQIKQLLLYINSHYQTKNTPKQLLYKIKSNKQDDTHFRKINHQEPFPIEIEKPNIEDIIKKQISYHHLSTQSNRTTPLFRSHNRSISAPKLQQGSKTYSSPWRNKKSFVDLYSNLPSTHKYATKIPNQLLSLRRSLDMTPKQKKPNLQLTDLKILPQINFYQFQTKPTKNNPEKIQQTSQVLNNPNQDFQSCYYIKSQRKPRKSNINDFDQIDKQFFKKQTYSVKKYIPKKQPSKQQNYQVPTLSKSFHFKRTTKKSELVLDYNVAHYKPNPISSILELFEKHNKQVTGVKNGRQIRISKDLRNLKNTSFQFRY